MLELEDSWIYQRGYARGMARAIIKLHAELGIPCSDEDQARLMKCNEADVEVLEKRIDALCILQVLSSRGISYSPEIAVRIVSCTDRSILKSWLSRAIHAATAGDLFEDAR